MSGPTTASYFALPLARALRARGVPPEQVLSGLQTGEALRGPREGRTPFAAAVAAWNEAVARTGCASLGLEAARQRQVGDYGALEYAARTSASLEAAFGRVARYHRLLNDRARLEICVERERTRFCYRCPGELAQMPPAYVEFVLAVWVGSARELSEQPVTPVVTLLPHAAPDQLAPYHEVFGADIRFGSDAAELHFAPAIMRAPLPRADAALGRVLDRHVEALLAELTTRGATTRAAALAIERRLTDGPPRLEDVAHDLELAPRALRGRLEHEGTTFLRVVDETRQRLAETMAADTALSLAEVAFRLGFSEPSAFYRAYRRWTGRTPRG